MENPKMYINGVEVPGIKDVHLEFEAALTDADKSFAGFKAATLKVVAGSFLLSPMPPAPIERRLAEQFGEHPPRIFFD